MRWDPNKHQRRSIRLQGYDYSQEGAYFFVTICAQNRLSLFGEVIIDRMQSNDAGRMVADDWAALPERFPSVQIDKFVVMPNHIHGIIVLTDPNMSIDPIVGAPLVGARFSGIGERAGTRPAPTDDDGAVTTLGNVVGASSNDLLRMTLTPSTRYGNALRGGKRLRYHF